MFPADRGVNAGSISSENIRTYVGELPVLEDEEVVFPAQLLQRFNNRSIEVFYDVDMCL